MARWVKQEKGKMKWRKDEVEKRGEGEGEMGGKGTHDLHCEDNFERLCPAVRRHASQLGIERADVGRRVEDFGDDLFKNRTSCWE